MNHLKIDYSELYIKKDILDEEIINKNILPCSFNHKIIMFDENSKIYYYQKKYNSVMNNDNYYYLLYSLCDRDLYEKIINSSPDKILEIIKNNVSEEIKTSFNGFYYQFDYYFPNINLAFYNTNSKKTWRKNIKKLYYDNDKNTISIKMKDYYTKLYDLFKIDGFIYYFLGEERYWYLNQFVYKYYLDKFAQL